VDLVFPIYFKEIYRLLLYYRKRQRWEVKRVYITLVGQYYSLIWTASLVLIAPIFPVLVED
jgi:hypothetical protein